MKRFEPRGTKFKISGRLFVGQEPNFNCCPSLFHSRSHSRSRSYTRRHRTKTGPGTGCIAKRKARQERSTGVAAYNGRRKLCWCELDHMQPCCVCSSSTRGYTTAIRCIRNTGNWKDQTIWTEQNSEHLEVLGARYN